VTITSEEILAGLQQLFEENYGEAAQFRARQLRIDQSEYVNDEELDKLEEREAEEVLTISELGKGQPLEGLPEEVSLVAVDSSSLHLGETDEGLAVAVRVSIVKQAGNTVTTEKFGPFVAHLTPKNTRTIYNSLRACLGQTDEAQSPALYKMPDRIRNLVERIAQRYACTLVSGGIILLDGALTRSMDTPRGIFETLFEAAQANSNSIVAISKHTRLWLTSGKRLIDIFKGVENPTLVEIPFDLIKTKVDDLLGTVHVVKFTADGFTFRVDVKAHSGDCREKIRIVKAATNFRYGYPEILCRAHINAFFTPVEGISLQGMFAERHTLEVLPSFDLRTYVFGPFGG